MDSVALRSLASLGPLVALDAEVAAALAARSLPKLQSVYTMLQQRTEDAETVLADGKAACGCDVALTNLLIIVGFAVNALDGEGRYQPWMKDESVRLLADYKSFAQDCATDAGRDRFASAIQPQHVEML